MKCQTEASGSYTKSIAGGAGTTEVTLDQSHSEGFSYTYTQKFGLVGGKWQTNEDGEGTASLNSTQIYHGCGSYSVGSTLFEIAESGDSSGGVDETFSCRMGITRLSR